MIQVPVIFTESTCVGFWNLSLRVRLEKQKAYRNGGLNILDESPSFALA